MAPSDSLTLPSATFAKLSPHPFLLANLQPPNPSTPPSRANGRQTRHARPYNINASSLCHAHGSAVVRSGDTTVICGVRGEILLTTQIPNYSTPNPAEPTNELGGYDLIVPNVELSTGCDPNHLPGVPPTTLAQSLSTSIYSLLDKSRLLNAEDFRIYNEDEERVVKAYWVLYIDILFISLDGNPFDIALAAVVAALRDTKLPLAYWNEELEMVLCRRPTPTRAPTPLRINGLPVACTAAIFTEKKNQKKGEGRYWMLIDPDRFETKMCHETVVIVLDKTTGSPVILSISKHGGAVVEQQLLKEFAVVAEARWNQFHAALP
ncbi:ribosomal protein S5 domain 2-like protein [Hypoxylon fragiforme]|uniref:ribosomal protein S5 domain 2-like protein n=1 Tax=Hypoxylon fragiforme TaxID=63214 RepID=UPI0020C6457C|nr:ribosomal protein S5 domain 2-like protein [Hypoxylon fragiforme]KAI2605273.1 ribosomal protein S5 domain 2-like protein [Hypoxylon fragiforme]